MFIKLTDTQRAYSPMTEAAYYILLALTEPRHGYGIMQYVEQITDGRLRLGPGTLYGNLARMERDQLIRTAAEQERRKIYAITEAGTGLLRLETDRLHELYMNGRKHLEVRQR